MVLTDFSNDETQMGVPDHPSGTEFKLQRHSGDGGRMVLSES